MIIPASQLSDEALNTILEEFICREGTDYGEHELSLEEKVSALKPQVLRGDVLIVYEAKLQSVQLMTQHDYDNTPTSACP